ncbi:MAG: UDP-2,3-diacylglucosamine diphosphatase [Burkholderiaceae bacterium]
MTPTVPPFAELMAPQHWRTVDFISDLHLQASEPITWQGFVRYLRTTPADAVFILGDLFEVWVGDDALAEPGDFEAMACAALRGASEAGRALFFLHGNRDFLIGPNFAAASGTTLLHDPTVLVWQGQRYLLSHGDALCLDDVDYQRFRTESRGTEWRSHFLSQPLAVRRAQARGIREQSEARKRAAVHYADVDTPAARAWLQAARARTLVHGHTHRPARHALGDGMERWVLSDWELDAQPPRADVLRLNAPGLEPERITPT